MPRMRGQFRVVGNAGDGLSLGRGRASEQGRCNAAPGYTHWCGRYEVRRGDRSFWYFRYYWMEGPRTKHVHVPGGDVCSDVVRRRVAVVQVMIEGGRSPAYIARVVRGWSRGRGWNWRKADE